MSNEVIKETKLLAPCDACRKTDEVKVFHFGGDGSRVFLALCPTCGLKFSEMLSSAFPKTPLPAWVTKL
jgi:hypothetical protein